MMTQTSGAGPRLLFARLFSAALRMREVQLAEWAFRGTDASTICTRRLFGHEMHLDVSRSSTHRLLYLMGERFVPERRLLAGLVSPRMTVVDVGANIGYYLLLFEHLLKGQGRVVCIEPSRENLVELRRNIAANQLTNAAVHAVAVGALGGQARLRSGLNGFVNEDEGAEVPLHTLDSLLDGHVDLVKIDVEGYEGHVIEGCVFSTLKRHHPVLFLELHPGIVKRFGRSPEEVVALLRPIYPYIEAWELAMQAC